MSNQKVKFNSKSTKQEIIEAYESYIAKIQNLPIAPKTEADIKQQNEIVEIAQESTVESVLSEISTFKSAISSSLDSISTKIITQLELFNNIQSAVEAGRHRLKQIYEIEINLDALANLINTYKLRENELSVEYEKKEKELQTTYQECKDKYVKMHEQLVQEFTEKNQALNKDRNREEEEYTHKIQFTRKIEQEEFEYQKQLKLKDLSDRQKNVTDQEEEIAILKEKVSTFPDILTQAVEATRKEIAGKLSTEHYKDKEAMRKEFDAELKLNETILNSLKEKSLEQAATIQKLNESLAELNNQVQTIAVTAINGAQKVVYQTSPEPQKK